METENSLASNLVYQRKLKGYTQKELSQKTNVTVRTIQRIEKGETEPHLQTVKLLATALEIEVEDLLPLDNPKNENIQTKWLLLMHATPFVGFVLPFFNVFIPLFLWIHKRDDNPVYYEHGRKVINFQISMMLYFVVAMLLALFFGHLFPFSSRGGSVAIIFIISILPFSVLVMLFNIYKVVKNRPCYYPLSIPFFGKKTKTKVTRGLAILAFLFSFSGTGYSQAIERLDYSKISSDSLTMHVEHLMKKAKVPGVGISVFNKNQIIYSRALGYANNNTGTELKKSSNMYGASLSKAVFSVIVMKLVEQNVIDLDTPLESYLPKKIYEYEPQAKWHDDYSDLKQDSLYHKITARMCLAHTSGFPNWRFFEEDKKLRVKQEPGKGYLYSGEGMVYLQVVLEKITGRKFEELAQEIVFEPLGMTNSSYQWQERFENDYAFGHNEKAQAYEKDKDNEPRAPSTLETSLEDYNEFLLAVLNRKILTDKSWNEIFTPQVRIRFKRQFGPLATEITLENDAIELSYGLGWGLFHTPYGWAAFKEGYGSGFQHHSVLFPDQEKAVLIMTNSQNSGTIFKELLEVSLKDTYTPWKWENYIPYNLETGQ
ncbi:DUF4870 domain-containing protein [Gramella sp. BOM4]|nr:DUF4870 domain-containing protein [Christiangramia bathymodioli]